MKSKITIYQRPNTRGQKGDAKGFSQEIVVNPGDIQALAQAVRFDNCMARYMDGHKIGTKFEASNCCLADIDNTHSDNPADWITPADVDVALSGVEYYCYPSRNHMKPKEGKAPRPKMHLVFPIRETTDVTEYTGTMKRLIETFPALHFDPSVKGPAQLNFGVDNAQVSYVDGEMNLSDFLEKLNPVRSNNDDTIPEGKRHSTLTSCAARVLKRYGDTGDKAYQAFGKYAKKCSPPLEAGELDGIWESALSFFRETIQAAPDYVSPAQYNDGQDGPTQAEILLELIEGTGAEFFHDELKVPQVVIPLNGHNEVWAVEGSWFKTWLKRLFYNSIGKPIRGESLTQVIGVLEGKAIFDGEMKPLSVRVAGKDDSFLYDLSDAEWRAVHITPEGWKIVNPPTVFIRYSHQAVQVEPEEDEMGVTRILKHINLKGSEILFLCWLISCFIPDIPHPVSIIYGEKGSAKSTASQFLKLLVDPSVLETLTLPNDSNSLAINLQKNWFLPFDNVSYLSEETSDTLCRAVTGGGIQQRKLYTNNEDVIFKFMRCIAINGVNCTATRPDLLDRAILLELARITEEERKELAVVQTEFEADRPYILGGKAHRIMDSIYHLMRGQVFTIDGLKFFTMGGATSHDKGFRCEGVTWWPEELPSDSEHEEAVVNLEKHGLQVDYIITHCAPDSVQWEISALYESDKLTEFLEAVKNEVSYKHWYFGHYHLNEAIDDKHTCVFDEIVLL